jgi:DNA repair protein RadC
MTIKEMHIDERPREKLLARGPSALADGELLAILLRTGRRGESVLELAQRLLSLTSGRLTGLFECDAQYLASLDGVGGPKAATLLAAFELGRRFMTEQSSGNEPIADASQVYSLMLPRLKGIKREECWILLLDRKNCVTTVKCLTIGGRKGTIFDIPLIIKTALEEAASGIILVHNHPGGDPRPSNADIRETRALKDACITCGLSMIDHIVIADEHFYSFSEEKMF